MHSKVLLAIVIVMSLTTILTAQKQHTPPATRRDDVVDTLHGVRIPDPYRWLEDQNSPETRAWIDAQNSYTQSILQALPGREHFSERLGQLMKIDNILVPIERNGRYFYRERRKDQELFVIRLRQGGKDDVLIDPHPMSADHTTTVEMMDVSEDGNLLAYGVRRGGADEVEVRVFDADRRVDLPDRLPTDRYFQVSFKPDKSGFYYSVMGKDAPHIRYHAMGTDPKQDQEIFGKGYGPENIAVCEISEDGRYLIIQVFYGAAADKTDVYYQDLARKSPIQTVVKDIDARFQAASGGDHLFLQTNWKAPNGRILAVDFQDPVREHWREVVPESDSVIDSFAVGGGRLLVRYLHNVTSEVKVFGPDGRAAGRVSFPTLGTVSEISSRWQGREAFFQFSSFHVPATVYQYDVSSGTRSEWARLQVPVDSDRFELKQVWYESKDKTRVPMFLLYKKGLKLDGSNPTLMTAYGGFDLSLTPQFSAMAVVWAEHGGVFALPNLRGGGEFGEKWHRAGMLGNKQNVFDDFFSAAEWLISKHYTKSSRLGIMGGSNGGLLMGASFTQRPELFGAVVCTYPLLDMLRYQNFLVAKFWVPEYGSSEDPEQFKYLYAYSPYHHVKKRAQYPPIMFMTGDSDTRVAPLHTRKMAALMQWATVGSARPILLHYDTKSGHSEGRPINKQIADTTDELTFLYRQLGVKP